MTKKLVPILFLMFGYINLAYSQTRITKSADGICIFYTNSPKMFEFVKTNKWNVTGDQLIDILSYRVARYILIPYRGFINNELFAANYLDTLSYGYNKQYDSRMIKIYYCNCKLLFKDTAYNEKLIDERYDNNHRFNKRYNYLYKGKPVRFNNMGLLGIPVDSVILFPR